MLVERGIDICHDTVRLWWNRFGPLFAAQIRKQRVPHRSYAQWRWYLDDVFATKRRGRRAALKFLKVCNEARPKVIVTDRLRSYGAAMKVIGVEDRPLCAQWLNNGAENSHHPFRRGEGAMARFRDIKTLQKFAAVHAALHNPFNHQRPLNRRAISKQDRAAALAE